MVTQFIQRIKRAFPLFAIAALLAVLALAIGWPLRVAAGSVRYVTTAGLASGVCGTWANACTLPYALSIAASGDELWVAAGVYKPTGDADRSKSFQLKNGVAVYGGFAGAETARSQRDWAAHVTTLSGDIGAAGDSNDNSYHVVSCNNVSNAVLDGFTITGGRASGSGNDSVGGGLYSNQSSPTVRNVFFRSNYASYGGGGMSNYAGNPTLINVAFYSNVAGQIGGGLYGNTSNFTLVNVTFNGNSAGYNGGAIYNAFGTAAVRNSIFWGDTPDEVYNYSGTTTITYSDVQGGYAGAGNINADPRFMDAANGDLRLRSDSPAVDAGDNTVLPADSADWDGDGNAAEPIPFDLAHNARQVDLPSRPDTGNGTPPIVDMGAYEAPPSVSISKSVAPPYAASGQTITYTLRYVNDYASTVTSVTITDIVPAQVMTTSVVSSGAAITPVGGTRYVWQVADLPPAAGGIITITGVISPGLALTNFTNTATIAATVNGTPTSSESSVSVHVSGILYATPAGAGDCMAWATACTLQTALGMAVPGDEIWAAEGVHKPTAGSDRTATFQLKSGVAVYGGFAGTETARSQRDWASHVTTLSGDVGAAGVATDNVYHVVTGSGTDATAVLDGFTVSGGYADGGGDADEGGGVFDKGGSPTLRNLTISNNYADYRGGGIYNDGASHPALDSMSFSNNQAVEGGGAYQVGNAVLQASNFISNTADDGGGLYVDGNLTATAVQFSGNTADDGGGAYVAGDALLNSSSGLQAAGLAATAAEFTGNTAFYDGGGLYVEGSLTVTNTRFISNTTTSGAGGGAYVIGDALLNSSGGLQAAGLAAATEFTGNTASDDGGALFVEGSLTATGAQFVGNISTSGEGGGALVYENATLNGGAFQDNRCSGSYCSGGGLLVYGDLGAANTLFSGNRCIGGGSYFYGGGAAYVEGDVNLNGGSFQNNQCTGQNCYGGALNTEGNLGMVDTQFSGNSANGSGGAAYVYGLATLTRGAFTGNSVAAWVGGGLGTEGGLTMVDTRFIGNTAAGEGGAAFVYGGAQITRGLFQDNSAPDSGGEGGGLSVMGWGISARNTARSLRPAARAGQGSRPVATDTLAITSTQFIGNSTGGDGGGVSTYEINVTITGALFQDNTAAYSGGGALLTAGSATLTGGLFRNNRAESGGGLYAGDHVVATGTQFINNTATVEGGGIYAEGGGAGSSRLVNVLLARNTAYENGAALYLFDNPGTADIVHTTVASPTVGAGAVAAMAPLALNTAAIYVSTGTVRITNTIVASYTVGIERAGGAVTEDYNLFFGNTTNISGTVSSGGHSIAGDPAFVAPALDDYHLTAGSAAIDHGVNAGVTSDFEGQSRPYGPGYDIGYDEFIPAILISEVLYDPPAGCTEPGAEWVELYNAGNSAITLTDWQLCDDAGCDTIPTSTIQPHEGLVVAGAQTAFLTCYTCSSGHVVYVADGVLGDGLGNDGDRVRLLDNNGTEVDAISYGADTYAFTPACPDVGEGHSLERYPIQQDTNAAGDFRDRSNPGPCQNPTAVGLARFAVRLSGWLLALLPALVALGLGGLLWARRNRGLSRQ